MAHNCFPLCAARLSPTAGQATGIKFRFQDGGPGKAFQPAGNCKKAGGCNWWEDDNAIAAKKVGNTNEWQVRLIETALRLPA